MLRQHHLQQAAQDSRTGCPIWFWASPQMGTPPSWQLVSLCDYCCTASPLMFNENLMCSFCFSFSKHLREWSSSCTLPYFKTFIRLLISFSPSWMVPSLSLPSYVTCSSPLLIFVVLSHNLEQASLPDIKHLMHKRLLLLKVSDTP